MKHLAHGIASTNARRRTRHEQDNNQQSIPDTQYSSPGILKTSIPDGYGKRASSPEFELAASATNSRPDGASRFQAPDYSTLDNLAAARDRSSNPDRSSNGEIASARRDTPSSYVDSDRRRLDEDATRAPIGRQRKSSEDGASTQSLRRCPFPLRYVPANVGSPASSRALRSRDIP